jgi:non-homologous end joining protein Ku
MDKQKLAEEMLKLAKLLVSEQEETDESDVEDPKFVEKIRNLRQVLTKLSQKKRRRLQQFGIGLIRPNATVEDLVDALMRVAVG